MGVKLQILVCLLLTTGCMNKAITMGATGAGAGLGGLAGPGGAAVGGMLAYSGTEMALSDKDHKDLVTNITEEAVHALVDGKLGEHKSGFEEFKETIQNILKVVGVLLLVYLCIPLLFAKYTAEKCVKNGHPKRRIIHEEH